MILRLVLTLLLLNPVLTHCQAASRVDRQVSPAGRQHFVCNVGYSVEQCNAQMAVLRRVLDRYPTNRLGDWTWVLIRSDDWKRLKERLQLDPNSPAFTYLARRQTFVEEALVTPVPGRSAELIRHWESGMDDLLTLAVTHELGHALCAESDEHRADEYGRLLRSGVEVTCRP